MNHGGDLDLALRMIDVAVDAGADAVKFQAFRTQELILDNVEKAPYQKKSGGRQTQPDMLRSLELKEKHYHRLKKHCEEQGIEFLITPFDSVSLSELERVGVHAYKVASTDTTNLPFLRQIAALAKPMILSTGMTAMDEIRQVVSELTDLNGKIILLQCTANYPITPDEANLSVMTTYRQEFGLLVGYSDHTPGIGAAPYAVANGAVLVEKHFTIDKSASGPDHEASLDPTELKQCIAEIRMVERYMGQPEKVLMPCESATRKSLQKCLVAARNIPAGQTLCEGDLEAKRTGGEGLSPLECDSLLGRTTTRAIQENDIFQPQDFS